MQEDEKDILIRELQQKVAALEEQLAKSSRSGSPILRQQFLTRQASMTMVDLPEDGDNQEGKVYALSPHWIQMDKSGTKQDVLRIDEILQNQPPTTGRQGRFQRAMSIESSSIMLRQRNVSFHMADRSSRPNRLLEALSYFEKETDEKPALVWKDVDMNVLGNFIIMMCGEVRKIFEAEERVLELPAPTYILGDIHGNYHDLSYFASALWGLGIQASPSTFLFLGDYVDRGPHSIEVVAHLVCLKLLAPKKVFLLRGNHELRNVNGDIANYGVGSFKYQCDCAFGDVLGDRVWEAVNQVFDSLPLAAIVDKQLFCTHGGMPAIDPDARDMDRLKALRSVPKNICDVSLFPIVEDCLWSDPADSSEEIDLNADGFGFNAHRGGGKYFGNAAVEQFLDQYRFSHLIRAHEVSKTGIQVTKHARVITIFSSSRYCGMDNEAACILVDASRIRVIILDTNDTVTAPMRFVQQAGEAADNGPPEDHYGYGAGYGESTVGQAGARSPRATESPAAPAEIDTTPSDDGDDHARGSMECA